MEFSQMGEDFLGCCSSSLHVGFQLNAFDSRHLDEVYFDVRLTAFQDATRRVRDLQSLDLDLISTIVYNCFHTYEVSRAAAVHAQLQSGVLRFLCRFLRRSATCPWRIMPPCACPR